MFHRIAIRYERYINLNPVYIWFELNLQELVSIKENKARSIVSQPATSVLSSIKDFYKLILNLSKFQLNSTFAD